MSQIPPPDQPVPSSDPSGGQRQPRLPPTPPRASWARPDPRERPPRHAADDQKFVLRALGGFMLFLATVALAIEAQARFPGLSSAAVIFSFAFCSLVILSFIFHRRGWLTGWLTGFLLAASLIGLVIYTCKNMWR